MPIQKLVSLLLSAPSQTVSQIVSARRRGETIMAHVWPMTLITEHEITDAKVCQLLVTAFS